MRLRKRKTFTIENPTSGESLRDRVYNYLNEGMVTGAFKRAEYLDQDKICRQLDVSKAPLRDALIRLEAEGFVTIQARRGVFINPTTLSFIKSAYQIIGAIESDCIDEVFHLLTEDHIKILEESNALQRSLLDAGKFREYYHENINFHNIFLSLSENELLESILTPLRRRIYDFPRRSYFLEWEEVHLRDHERFIESIRRGNKAAAISIFRHEHWSFDIHRRFMNSHILLWARV